MSRFTDSPYFLLRDFVTSLVSPPNPEYLQPDIVNFWKNVLFTDVIVLGGSIGDAGYALNTETSTNLSDTITRYPLFDAATDQSQIFTSDEVAWNGFYDRSPISSYYLSGVDINGDTASVGVLMRNGDNTGELVIEGGAYVDLYAKKDDYGFVPVKFVPVDLPPVDKKYFRFVAAEDNDLQYDGTVVVYDSDVLGDEPYYDSDHVSIQTYDYTYDSSLIKWGNLTMSDIIENGVELYFRKDGSFHSWLKEFAVDYYKDNYDIDYAIRNFVNTDKLFIYFGETYNAIKNEITDPDTYHVVFNGLKDWVQDAVPINDRRPNFIEFMDTYFDQVYSEGYELLKNVWTLRDGWECDRRFLGYIPTFYGVDRYDDVPEWFTDSFREYASELIWLMKRKGTYASAQIIYELFCNNSKNIFSIIEKWHVDSTGVIGDEDVSKYIYTGLYGKETPSGFPGAGAYWYSQFLTPDEYPEGYLSTSTLNETDDMMMAPSYRLDLDLSSEPVTNFQILPEQISTALYSNWEMTRPINRQAEYNLIYAPYTDLTGVEYSLYEAPNAGQSVTKSLDNLSFDADNFIHIQRDELGSWVMTHTLDTMNVIVTSYSSDFEKQEPSAITVVDNGRIVVDWGNPTTGLVIISKAASPLTTYDSVSWRIRHGLNRKEILYQIRTVDNVVYFPEDSYIGDLNTSFIEGALHPDSQVFIKAGLSLGDTCDSDSDGVDDTVMTQDIWVFDSVAVGDPALPKEVSVYSYMDPDTEITTDWYAWVIDHPNIQNIYQVLCYGIDNYQMTPANILLNELDVNGLPQLVVLWSPIDAVGVDPVDYLGFAAIDNVGDLVSFFGIVPKDAEGDLMSLQWRVTLETDDDVYTFLTEGSNDAGILFAGSQKDIHYYDYSVPDDKPYIHGTSDYMEEDDVWYYYTFTITDEALSQLNVKDYKITAIELFNHRVSRITKQRVVYSRLSGIYKPQGVNFVCHFRIYKDLAGLGAVLTDHVGDALLDSIEEYLYG